MTRQEQERMLAALMSYQTGNARFGSVDFAGTPVIQALGGEQANIERRRQRLFEPATPKSRQELFPTLMQALVGRFQENQEAADTTALYGKLAGPEITEADYEAYSSPYLAQTREAKQEAIQEAMSAPTDEGLGIDAQSAQSLYAPESLDMAAPAQLAPGFTPPSLGLDPSQLKAFPSIDTPRVDPRMMSALIGDPRTVEQERAASASAFSLDQSSPRALLDRIGSVETNTDAGRNLQQQMMASTQIQEAAAAREAALLAEKHVRDLELKRTGPPPALKPTVSIKPVADPGSSTGWSFKNVLDPYSPSLGEAQGQLSRFDPDAATKGRRQALTDSRYEEALTGLGEVDTIQGNIDQMRGLTENTQTGSATELITDLKKLGNRFGMSFDPGEIANVETMRAVGMKFILAIIAKTKGAISQREMEAFEAASPGAGITKAGNKQILDFAEAAAARLVAAHQAVREAYRVDNATRISLDDAFLKSKEDWGGFGFIFAPGDLAPDLRDGWGGLTWQEKKAWYDKKGLTY